MLQHQYCFRIPVFNLSKHCSTAVKLNLLFMPLQYSEQSKNAQDESSPSELKIHFITMQIIVAILVDWHLLFIIFGSIETK